MTQAGRPPVTRTTRHSKAALEVAASRCVDVAALKEARRAGLLDADNTAHFSFRAPAALVEAAKRETGLQSTTELGLLALAMLAQPDPVTAFMRRTRGRLGRDHTLET